MSNIRILGIVIAVSLVCVAFAYFRGPRWSRANVVALWLVALGLLVISVDPESVNALRDVFAFGQFEYGRMFAVLVLSTIVLFFVSIYTKIKIDSLAMLMDRYMRAEVLRSVEGPDKDPEPNSIMVVIPALNEAENLRALLPRIPKSVLGRSTGVLVVNDGSDDDTREVALANGCWVASLPINRGQGAAQRIGFGFLSSKNLQFGVTMDADNQHQPAEIAKIIEPVISGRCDLVIGSRILGTADKDSRVRFVGVILLSRLVSLLTATKITDCSSGFKGFNVHKMLELDLRQDQFQSSEILIASAKKGLRILEVPIHISRRSYGQSRKGTNFWYGLFFFKTVLRTWWR
jgi:hypothetical protein